MKVNFQDEQSLAGVVGIDVAVSRLEAAAPRPRLGPMGYAFAVNQNGLLIFHPNLWMDANYMEDPAHIDLEDIEGEDGQIKELRRVMVNRPQTPGTITIERPIDLETRQPLASPRHYHYVQVPDTTFS